MPNPDETVNITNDLIDDENIYQLAGEVLIDQDSSIDNISNS